MRGISLPTRAAWWLRAVPGALVRWLRPMPGVVRWLRAVTGAGRWLRAVTAALLWLRAVPAALLWLLAVPAAAQEHMQHEMATAPWWHLGLHAVGMGTYVRNGVGGEPVAEGYLTQPTVMAVASLWGGRLTALTTVSLEGLTLERGELAPGSYGEGYVDRRHPHTYLHEALVTMRTRPPARAAMSEAAAADGHEPAGSTNGTDAASRRSAASGGGLSLTAGRGFAPFGTDDPMVRPFVRFPANHHLSQALERLVLIGAARRGPVVVEAGLFSGDEPSDPEDLGTPARFADSWAVRATLLPARGVELQASRARVESPELPLGGGWDQRMWSASARYEAPAGPGALYALLEWARTAELNGSEEVFSFGSVLGETSYTRSAWMVGARLERSERPEEDRISAYRTPWPHAELHVLGITRWTIGSAMVRREARWRGLRLAPFVEAALAHVGDRERGLFEIQRTYGGHWIGSVSVGARVGAGMRHARMGRYGVALP